MTEVQTPAEKAAQARRIIEILNENAAPGDVRVEHVKARLAEEADELEQEVSDRR